MDPVAANDHARASLNTGITAFVFLLRLHGLPADVSQLRHQYGDGFGYPEMLRAGTALGLKVKTLESEFDRLGRTPWPAIAGDVNGQYFILAKVVEDKVLIQYPESRQPQLITRGELESIWDKRLLLMARRATLGDLAARFDFSWFL